MNIFERIKYSDQSLWYELSWGLIVNTKWYFHLYYKHTKRHKDEMKRIREGVLRHKKEVMGERYKGN